MKKLFCIVICASFFAFNYSSAQLLDKIKNKVKNRADQKVDQSIDKGLDKVEGAAKTKTKTEDGETKVKTEDGETKIKTESKGLKSYSKYDFIPGEKIVYAEDFAQDVIGEFPLKWNTNGSGEVTTIENVPGKWLKVTEDTKYDPPYANKLPENYTVEFDLLAGFKDDQRVPSIDFKIYRPVSTNKFSGITLSLMPNNGTNSSEEDQPTRDRADFLSHDGSGGEYLQGKDQLIGEFTKYNHTTTPVHIAIWVQKERVRAWINQVKVYDLPKGLSPDALPDRIGFEIGSYGGAQTNYQFYVSNLKIAVALPDTRSKLITEGKWSTSGILFDVNSDKIKPTSYGVLKEIAAVLTENADVKVRIIGHTDSDGDDAKNLDLSKRRAAAVKAALSKEFNIDASRMETDGVGETNPAGENKTPEGKAQNRRVEFVKL